MCQMITESIIGRHTFTCKYLPWSSCLHPEIPAQIHTLVNLGWVACEENMLEHEANHDDDDSEYVFTNKDVEIQTH